MYCLCVNMYCTTATGCQLNCSWQIYQIKQQWTQLEQTTVDKAVTGVQSCFFHIIFNFTPQRRKHEKDNVRPATLLFWQSETKGRFTHSIPCPCRAHAVPLPCRAAKGLECIFPIWFTQCGRVWFTLAMPRPCHDPTMPFFSRPQHKTAVERRPVGSLYAFGFFPVITRSCAYGDTCA